MNTILLNLRETLKSLQINSLLESGSPPSGLLDLKYIAKKATDFL